MSWIMSDSECMCVSGTSCDACINTNCACWCTDSDTGEEDFSGNLESCMGAFTWVGYECDQSGCADVCVQKCEDMNTGAPSVQEICNTTCNGNSCGGGCERGGPPLFIEGIWCDCCDDGVPYPGTFSGQFCDSQSSQGKKTKPRPKGGSGNNNNRRNKMARGKRAPKRDSVGRAPARGMSRGGRTAPRPAPKGRGRAPARGMSRGGRTAPIPAPKGRGGAMAGGGRVKPGTRGRGRGMARGGRMGGKRGGQMASGGRANIRKMPGGGTVGGYNYGNTGCNMWTGKIDCDAKPGCSWNFDDNCCH